MKKSKTLYRSRKIGMPSNVELDKLDKPAEAKFVWGTILFFWMLSLLSFFFSVNLLAVVIVFWCVYDSPRIGLFTAFIFGLLVDVHESLILGENALFFTLFAYFALAIQRRLLRFDLLSQAIHLFPVLFLSKLISKVIISWVIVHWMGLGWVIEIVLIIVVWPVLGSLLLIPQRSVVNSESKSVH
ncbi:rod shape-determining protein MreD [Candidatus Kinetoplastibacterium desouzaii TCC079E]|uniref:Rod shape-determining protein MreD n=1 Tax=Candidatus Kinetoplastidibacterium desouzai TCC079E TaxID=1208919 RepID=M1L389_9PROT|nr:rod shape-determining protein MreD [Candidatus Kinetoplastibacterium desouzaii]AGF47213.1 rod shape-determining protein MreD [Candidatus Kinetoplastibacterium desouzaii TCC079E]